MTLDNVADALRDSVRDVLVRENDSARLHQFVDSGRRYDEALWREAGDLGWTALAVPEAFGGLGLSAVETAAVFEELGRSLAPIPLLGSLLAVRALTLGGTPAQQEAFLPRLASGELKAAVAWPTAGHSAPLPLARREGEGLRIDGVATNLLQGAEADLLIFAVQLDSGETAFAAAEPARDGLALAVEATQDRTRHLTTLTAAGLALPLDRLLTASSAPDLARTLQAEAELALAADAVGGAEAIFERTLDYLKTREQFGRPIGSFQALKHRCADHKVAMTAAAAVTREAARRLAEGADDAQLLCALAKAYACEIYAKVAEDAVQLHGGIGFTWEHDCHLYLKRAKLNQALFGTTAAAYDRAADLLASPARPMIRP